MVKICDFGLARDIYKNPDYVRKGDVSQCDVYLTLLYPIIFKPQTKVVNVYTSSTVVPENHRVLSGVTSSPDGLCSRETTVSGSVLPDSCLVPVLWAVLPELANLRSV